MNQNTPVVSEPEQNQPKRQDAVTRWRKLLEDQRASGLPISAFCRERGVAASSLFAWRRRLAAGVGAETFKPVTIVVGRKRQRRVDGDDGAGAGEAIELPAAAAGFIELRLRGERRLIVRRGFDRQLLGEVICVLEALA